MCMCRYLLTIMLLLSWGCGETSTSDVPDAFAADVNEFYALTGDRTPVTIRYGALPEPYRGLCQVSWEIRGASKHWDRVITISPVDEPTTPWRRKALIWHEMFHCTSFQAGHVDDVESLMYPSDRGDLSPEDLEKYWQESLYDQALSLAGR